MTAHKKIWLVLDSRNFGGIETHVLELAKGLIKHQIQVEVIFLANYGHHPITPLLRQHNIPFRMLRFGLLSLIKALFIESPTLVHTHGYKAGIYGRVAGVLTARTLVSTFHAGECVSGKLAVYDFFDRLSSVLSHSLIAVSNQISARLTHQCTVLNNFVSVEQQRFPGNQIAFVGRLSYEKGPDSFIELSSCFKQRLFHVYGDGPMREQLEKKAGDNVIFHGHQANMAQQWQNIGLLVMPSRNEGLPMAALEAMAHGIPVCAYNVGSLNQLINDCNGWLAQAGDIKSLRYAISQWLSYSLKRKFSLSRRARKRIVNKFSDVTVVPDVVDCYNQALIKNSLPHQQLLPKYLPQFKEHSHDFNQS